MLSSLSKAVSSQIDHIIVEAVEFPFLSYTSHFVGTRTFTTGLMQYYVHTHSVMYCVVRACILFLILVTDFTLYFHFFVSAIVFVKVSTSVLCRIIYCL